MAKKQARSNRTSSRAAAKRKSSRAAAPKPRAKATTPRAKMTAKRAKTRSAKPTPRTAAARATKRVTRQSAPRSATRQAAPRSMKKRLSSMLSRRRTSREPVAPVTDTRMISAARAGHDELMVQLAQHTEASPVLTAGDVDAKWQDAYAIGDEAPGGDNPTPGQDRVDEIGKALGIEYQDAQELQGGEEVAERDHHRWELDPASSEDWPRDKKKRP